MFVVVVALLLPAISLAQVTRVPIRDEGVYKGDAHSLNCTGALQCSTTAGVAAMHVPPATAPTPPPAAACGAGQVVGYDGSAFMCVADEQGVASITTTSPIDLGPGTASVPNIKLADCGAGEIFKHDGSAWWCMPDDNTTYTASSGVQLSGSDFQCVDASSSAKGCITTGPQPLAGHKTFNDGLTVANAGGIASSYPGPFPLTSNAPATAAVDVAHVTDTTATYASLSSTDRIEEWRAGGTTVAYLTKFDFVFPTGVGLFAGMRFGSGGHAIVSTRSNAGAQNAAIYSAANASGETAVAVGTSDTTTGQTSFGVCNDCDGTPVWLMTVGGDGSASFLSTVTAPSFVGALTGNASTATALAADPVACGSNQWVRDVANTGVLTCTQPGFSNISGTVAFSQLPDASTIGLPLVSGGLFGNPGYTAILSQSVGGTGTGTLTCGSGQVLTSNGTTYSCTSNIAEAQQAEKLLVDPPDCSGWGQWAKGIDREGVPTCVQVDFGVIGGAVDPTSQIQDTGVTDGQVLTSMGGMGLEWRTPPYQGSFSSTCLLPGGEIFSATVCGSDNDTRHFAGTFRPSKSTAVIGSISCSANDPRGDTGALWIGIYNHTDDIMECSCQLSDKDGNGGCNISRINPADCECLNDGLPVVLDPNKVYGIAVDRDNTSCDHAEVPGQIVCNAAYSGG